MGSKLIVSILKTYKTLLLLLEEDGEKYRTSLILLISSFSDGVKLMRFKVQGLITERDV